MISTPAMRAAMRLAESMPSRTVSAREAPRPDPIGKAGAKATPEMRQEVLRLRAAGATLREIRLKTLVSESVIWRICSGARRREPA